MGAKQGGVGMPPREASCSPDHEEHNRTAPESGPGSGIQGRPPRGQGSREVHVCLLRANREGLES